jgi:hypothetical protein
MTRRTKAKAPTPILTANVAGWRLNYHQPACFVSNRKAAAALSAGVDMRDAADVAPGCPVAIRVLNPGSVIKNEKTTYRIRRVHPVNKTFCV